MFDFSEKYLLEDLKKAFAFHSPHRVVYLDECLRQNDACFVFRLEDILPQTGFHFPAHYQSRFTVIYVTQGEGSAYWGTRHMEVKGGTLLLIPSGTVHSLHFSGQHVKGYYLSFHLLSLMQNEITGPVFRHMKWFRPEGVPYSTLDSAGGESLKRIFEGILYEVHHDEKNRMLILWGKMLELLVACDRIFQAEEKGKATFQLPLFLQYIDLIQAYYKTEHTVHFYASRLGVHPNSLNALTRRNWGRTAKSLIDDKLVREAELLLHHTGLSAKEIAYELGFHSPSHFFRFFKIRTGHTPLNYRRQHLN